ncbi:MAG: rRNA maturation RNase YbeY [Burkholderiales bacterium]
MRTAKRARRAAQPKRKGARHARKLQLTVQYATRARPVPTERAFRNWVRAAMRTDGRLTLRLVGIAEGRTLNRQYRGRDYATNVLTFVLEDAPPYHGDIALCAPVVSREAREQGKDVMAHYAHLTIHGVLHLQGNEHEREPDAEEMERLETRILRRLGFPAPYATQSPQRRDAQ